MIPQPLDGLKIDRTDETMTAHAGLALVSGVFDALELPARVNTALACLKQRQRGYSPAEFIRSLVLLHVAGGDCLDDIRVLDGDSGLRTLLGGSGLPAANTLGTFLHSFGHRRTPRSRRSCPTGFGAGYAPVGGSSGSRRGL